MKKANRLLALLLALVMVFGVMTIGAAAEEEPEIDIVYVDNIGEFNACASGDAYQVIVINKDMTLTEDVTTSKFVEFGDGFLSTGDHTLTVTDGADLYIDIFDADRFQKALDENDNYQIDGEGRKVLLIYDEVAVSQDTSVPEDVDVQLVDFGFRLTSGATLTINGMLYNTGSTDPDVYTPISARFDAFAYIYYYNEENDDNTCVLYADEEAMLAGLANPPANEIVWIMPSTYNLEDGGTAGTVTINGSWQTTAHISQIFVQDGTSLVFAEGANLTVDELAVLNWTDNGVETKVVVADGASLTAGFATIHGDLIYGPGANVNLGGTEIYGNYPGLMFRWLENDGEGWYENPDRDFDKDFVISPSDEFWVIFYTRTWNEEEDRWVETPVDPADLQITGEGLVLTPVQEIGGEVILVGEDNAPYFVRVSCEAWDQDYVLSYNGLNMYGDSYQREVAFYSDYDGQLSKENFINWYGVNPVQENVFYFGMPEGYDYQLENVQLIEGEGQVTLTPVVEGKIYKLTVNSSTLQDSPEFTVNLAFDFTNGEDHWDGYTYGIGVGPISAMAWKDGSVWYDEVDHVEENDSYTASYFDHLKGQLRSTLTLTEGQSIDGVVYTVGYDYERQVWRCDPYPTASLWFSNNGVVNAEQIPSDWQDWDGLESTLTAVKPGTTEIYLRVWSEDNRVWSDMIGDWTTPLTVTVEKKPTPVTPSKPSTGSSSSTSKTEEPALPFTDVSENASYYDAVKYVYEQDLMNGTSDTKFSPSGTLNRAMVVTILHRLEGEPAVSATGTFTDVAAGTWYTDGVEWAAANDIVNGYGNGTFGPTRPVTREQLATMLYRYAQFKGYDVTKTADLSGYTDGASVSKYAEAAVAWAVANGILESANGQLRPTENATRAEVAIAVAAFHAKYVK